MKRLPQIIQRAADRDADQDAFRCDGQALSYGELVQRSHRLAGILRESGVKPGDRVAVLMPRCLNSAIAVYGVMAASAAYVPLDPHLPVPILRRVCDDCGVRHIVTTHSLHSRVRLAIESGLRPEFVFGVDEELPEGTRSQSWASLFDFPVPTRADVVGSDDDLAYIIYTSGSTGRPKGIMHTHFSGLSYARLMVETYGIRPHDRLGSHSPLHFDMSTFGYFAGPTAGATSVLVSEPYTMMPASLSQLIQDEAITIWYSVPFALVQLLQRGALESRDVSPLRWAVFAGEVFPPSHLKALMKAWPHVQFSNAYGPSETNVCTCYHVPAAYASRSDAAPLSIGQAWGETTALVVDECDRPVENGCPGELLVRSSTVMKGYWARSDLDQLAFYQPPKASPGDRPYYRTGDLVQRDAAGNFEFLGRKDRQVKIRGFRVELDAIESVLSTHPAVNEAAVLTRQRDDEAVELIAIAAVTPESPVGERTLGNYLAEHLPPHALPDEIQSVSEMARTANGKIDRQALAHQLVTSHD